jgi:6-phosphogluconolactonase
MRKLVICETPLDVADAAAGLIHEQQTRAIEERGVFRMALSGGETPKLLYEILASEEWRKEMAWEQWQVFWSDERAVPPDHTESNYYWAKKLWLDHGPVTDVYRMRGEAEDLRAAAEEYARILKVQFGTALPEFDSIMLGMGADGHTASLFPGQAALNSPAVVEAVEVKQPIAKRLTLTLPVLNAARQVIFIVAGTAKAERVRDVLENLNPELPAARVNPPDGICWWLLDHEAARLVR